MYAQLVLVSTRFLVLVVNRHVCFDLLSRWERIKDQMFRAIIQANIRQQSKVLSKRVDLFYLDCAMNFGTKTEMTERLKKDEGK